MRILLLAQLLPYPLDAGPKIRTYYVLRHLAEAGHDVTLLCYRRQSDREADIDVVRRFCHDVHTVPLVRSRARDLVDGTRALLTGTPFLLVRDRRRALDIALDALTRDRQFDALHVDQLWMAPTAEQCRRVEYTVLDQHNAVFKVADRMADVATSALVRRLARGEARRLEAYERRIVHRFSRVVWVSARDYEAVCGPGVPGPTHAVIPIAVDTAQPPLPEGDGRLRVTFVGGLHWPPNAEGVDWFLQEVWPTVARAMPSAVLTIVGGGSRRRIGRHRMRVEVTGRVLDLMPYLAETAAFIVPLRVGAGVRVKILDAWCAGLPVVTTRLGAEGLEAVDGENALLADEADAFAARVIAVLRDARLRRRLGAGGRATVEAHYDWRAVYGAWDRIYH